MREGTMIHPVGARLVAAADVAARRWFDAVSERLMLSSWEHPDQAISGMIRHTAGIGSRGVVMTVFLTDDVHFVTGPDEDASRITIEGVIPDSVHPQLVGRHVTDVVDHDILRVDGLTIRDVRTATDGATGRRSAYVELAPVPWRRIGGDGDARDRKGGRLLRGILDAVKRR